MSTRELTLQDLLERVDILDTLESTLAHILDNYNLGTLIRVEPMFVGHEEMNVAIVTSTGKYGVKFINKRKPKSIAQGLVDAMLNFDQQGIPVTKLHSTKAGQYLFQMKPPIGRGFLFIADYFEGKTFHQTRVTNSDLVKLTQYIAQIHQLKFTPHPEYDFWLPQYLAKEFKSNGKCLNQEDRQQVDVAVKLFQAIDFSRCSQSIGHFDLHRDNIKKDSTGNICFFDLATVGLGASILDLGSFIGFFLDPHQSLRQHQRRYHLIVNTYTKVHHLNQYELSHLFDCVKIIFASNVLGAYYLIATEDDDTEETHKWYRFGKWGLNTLLSINSQEFI